ncbi:unnamed protein product [Closterium sp. Yama58-4]|nr:unnamed protein product [Closterium sp. Yama58-4]
MQVIFTEWHFLEEQPTPKGLVDGIKHLAFSGRCSAHRKQEKSMSEYRAICRMRDTASIEWFEHMLIKTAFNDHNDGVEFQRECALFIEAIQDHTKINTLAEGWPELMRPRAKIDYRDYLMEWAHAMGFVVQGGPYDHLYAADVRGLFGQNGRPLPEALIVPDRRGWVGGPNGISVSNLSHALGMLAWWEKQPPILGCEYRQVDKNGRAWRVRNKAEADHLAKIIPTIPRLVRQSYSPPGYYSAGFPDEKDASDGSEGDDDDAMQSSNAGDSDGEREGLVF